MKRTLRLLTLLVVLGLPAGCDTWVPTAPEATPAAVFDDLWEGFDRYAGNLALRGVDWDSVRAVHRPRFTDAMTDEALFEALADVAYAPRDPHVRLLAPGRTFYTMDRLAAARGWSPGFDEARVRARLGASAREEADGRILYGRLPGDVGYLHVGTFSGGLEATWFARLDTALAALRDTRALVVDVRDNTGGNGIRARDFAGRFADAAYPYLHVRQRLGTEEGAWTDAYTHVLRPTGPWQYRRPVVVLTSYYTISAAERFTLSMQRLPQVTVVGTPTAGTPGSTHERELVNGWRYALTFEAVTDADGRHLEGRGVQPDVPARPVPGRDVVLDRALALLDGA